MDTKMNTTDNTEKRKREDENDLTGATKIQNRGQHLSNNTSFLLNIPEELLSLILGNLKRKDLINLSCINREHRRFFYSTIFRQIEFKWKDTRTFLDSYKQVDTVEKVKIICDLENKDESSNREWNVSFKKLFETFTNLNDMHIELLTSGRSLKYKDDFDIELSNKITKMTLVSHSRTNVGEVNENAMFELPQLQRFHKIRELTLKGFTIARDMYFFPAIKEDMSDYKKRINDGKLVDLEEIKLVNCAWGHPNNMKDVFSPEYPIPGVNSTTKNCKPHKLGVYYSGDYITFTASERFKCLINMEYNKTFFFEVDFFDSLKEMEVVIMNDRRHENEFTCYYPWLDMINLRREYFIEDPATGEMTKRSILGNLQRLVLVGWRTSSIQELDKCFRLGPGQKYSLEHFELYLMRSGNHQRSGQPVDADEKARLAAYRAKLQGIFGSRCSVTVGYVDECMDGRYDGVFGESFSV